MEAAVPGEGSGVGVGQHQDVAASGAAQQWQIINTKWQLVAQWGRSAQFGETRGNLGRCKKAALKQNMYVVTINTCSRH